MAPLSLVQAFSAAGLALVVPASARVAGSPGTGQSASRRGIIAALALLAISPATTSAAPWAPRLRLLFLGLSASRCGRCSAAMRGPRRGAALALAARVLYGLSDAASEGFTSAAGHGVLGAVLSPWPPVIVALCAAAFLGLPARPRRAPPPP